MPETAPALPAEDVVERRFVIPELALESGAVLRDATLVYATRGRLDADGTNAVLVPSHYGADLHGSDWMIGPGRPLDTDRFYVVTTELFANGRSSSPSTTPPPHDGPRFPAVSIRDNVAIQHRLLTEMLGVRRLAAVVGFSMGAMQSLQWAVSHPEMVDRAVATCGTARSYPHGSFRLEGLIAALTLDPAFAGGDYDAPPAAGLSAFGMTWGPWLYSQRWWRDGLWTTTDRAATFESAVERFRSAFLPGADANDLIAQCRAWQRHDVGATPGFGGDTAAALRSIRAEVLCMPSLTDLYFPADDARLEAASIPRATVAPIPSLWGHPAGSAASPTDAEFVGRAIRAFLAGAPVPGAEEPDGVHDQLAGDYLTTLAVLLGGVARVTVPVLDETARAEFARRFDASLAAVAERSIPGLHEHGWGIVTALVDHCPLRTLAMGSRTGIDHAVSRFTATAIAQVADWDLLAERYAAWRDALLAGDPDATADAITALYVLPGPDAL